MLSCVKFLSHHYNGKVKGAHDVIILSNFGFNIFKGFRSTGGRSLHCSIDFAGHRYNSAAATAQPSMITGLVIYRRAEVAMMTLL